MSYQKENFGEYVVLPSGDHMPIIGLGCWQSPPNQLAKAVEEALEAGYRHIDGATIYGNEEAIGRGIRKAQVRREEIWVTTKLWNDDHDPSDVLAACKTSLANLGLDYLDLWLMHYPAATQTVNGGIKVMDISFRDTWRAMEEVVDLGLVRNIGISNFSQRELADLWQNCRIKPAVHQLERHPYLPQRAFVNFHRQLGLHVTAYSPLGNTNPSFAQSDPLPPVLQNPIVLDIARKYDITPANVLISLQTSEGCSVLPKSVTPKRIRENLKRVQLASEDVRDIAESCEGRRKRYADFSELVGYKYYDGLDDQD